MHPLLLVAGLFGVILLGLEKETPPPRGDEISPVADKKKKRKKNKSAKNSASAIDDSANAVPVSPPTDTAQTVPTDSNSPSE